jgi:hypothetical protein
LEEVERETSAAYSGDDCINRRIILVSSFSFFCQY